MTEPNDGHIQVPILHNPSAGDAKNATPRDPREGIPAARPNRALAEIAEVELTQEELAKAVSAAAQVASSVQEADTGGARLDKLSFELGLSLSGKVGLLGIGAEASVAAKFSVTLVYPR